MKIKQLDIKGFRSLKDASWQPGDLNVVIGQNGTGKSNLLRVLELIAASAQGRLSKHIQAAGGMGAIVWDGVAPSISIRLVFEQPNLEYEMELYRIGNSGSYRVRRELLTGEGFLKGDEPPPIKHIERSDGQSFYRYLPLDQLKKDEISQEETLLSFPFPLNPDTTLFRDGLSKIAVYHDLNVGQDSTIRQSTIARFEKRIDPDGKNLVPVLHTLYSGDREFKRDIDSAMRAAFGDDYEEIVFPPAADQRVQLRVRWRTLQREQSAADLSDGTLRFLLLLTILTAPDPPMLIAIDEPETGLHPAMYPIIAEFAVEAASRTQLVFTTHSAQFLDAFTENKPTTTVASWENGETSLHTLEGAALDYWLKDYSLGALFESGQLEAMT
jgi:predicted ATPase